MNYFALDYTGEPFKFLGLAHIIALILILLLNIYLLRFRKADEETRGKIRVKWLLFYTGRKFPGTCGISTTVPGASRNICHCMPAPS